jgi:hypothetical protein
VPFIASSNAVGGDQLRRQFSFRADNLDFANRCFRTFVNDFGMRLQFSFVYGSEKKIDLLYH